MRSALVTANSSWSVETGGRWLISNPARGQCSVTALVVQDILGGDILKTDVGGCWHFYNQIGARRWDLTISQFETPIRYDNLSSTREEALADTSPEQYRLLRQRIFERQHRPVNRTVNKQLEPVASKLPADFDTMRGESRAEGYAFLDRLVIDWAAGRLRFDKDGEVLLAAYSEGALAAVGGITIDPVVPDALRMRRFYVRSAFRRVDIGRDIAHALLERAFRASRVVTVNAGPGSLRFWESIGFLPQVREGHTHVHCLALPMTSVQQDSPTTQAIDLLENRSPAKKSP
jgi:GNAT superfamily N-acetyltransferase